MDARRYYSSRRKMEKALVIFDGTIFNNIRTTYEYISNLKVIQSHTLFVYRDKEYRFDYEFDLTQRLPRVGQIREILWDTLMELPSS